MTGLYVNIEVNMWAIHPLTPNPLCQVPVVQKYVSKKDEGVKNLHFFEQKRNQFSSNNENKELWMVYEDGRFEVYEKVRRVAEPRVVMGKTVGQRRESKLS